MKLLIIEINYEQQTTRKGETWSRGTNSPLPLDVNVMLNLSYNDGQTHLSALLLCSFV